MKLNLRILNIIMYSVLSAMTVYINDIMALKFGFILVCCLIIVSSSSGGLK